jgi:hypothetical protein
MKNCVITDLQLFEDLAFSFQPGLLDWADVNVAALHSVNDHLSSFWFFHSQSILGTNDEVGVLRSFGDGRTQ